MIGTRTLFFLTKTHILAWAWRLILYLPAMAQVLNKILAIEHKLYCPQSSFCHIPLLQEFQ